MITQMKKYTFLVFHRDYEPFLEQLRELGVVHITQKAAGLIEDDEQLQAALQHEDELNERIVAAQEAAKQAAVWGDFDAKLIESLKEAGYTLHFYECSSKSFEEGWGIKVNEVGGKTYFVALETLEDLTELPLPQKSAAACRSASTD